MNHEILASNIRFYRKAAGLTQEQLGSQLFLSAQTISKWENALTVPDLENVCMLASVLHIPFDKLFDGVLPPAADVAYLGIDGGGTKTEFVLFSPDGEVYHRIVAGGTNPNIYGIEAACATLSQGITAMLQLAKHIDGVFAGIAGSSAADHAANMQKALQAQFPNLPIRIESDIMNVFYSTEEQPSTAVILGTGAVVYVRTTNGLKRLGGYGYLLDGAGSGYDIGRDILCACLEAEDGLRAETPLLQAARVKWGGGRLWDVLDTVYNGGKEYIASFAPLAFTFYTEGDSLAADILRKNLQRIAELLDTAAELYGADGPAVLAGGLTARADIISEIFRTTMKHPVPLIFPTRSPIYGACVYCHHLFAKEDKPKTFGDTFAATYNDAKGE
ncbi:MAG: XRE family transcriptional regulator [Clostridia bacterium]|nr:XRE family transcriptional regulator [Clostridia bacterium]